MSSRSDLALEAFDTWSIPNTIEPDPSATTVAAARREHEAKIRAAEEVAGPSGRYNCFGLVLASRRTNVGKTFDLEPLLRRDRYHPIEGEPRKGDVAVYRDKEGKIEHAGHVIDVSYLDRDGELPVARVWSRWGNFGEFVHQAAEAPYGSVEYWRLSL